MKRNTCVWIAPTVLILAAAFRALTLQGQTADASDSPYNIRPAVTQEDLRIAQRAREILNSAANWNRAETRVCRVKLCKNGCPTKAKTFSLYCALQKATDEVTDNFEHRG